MIARVRLIAFTALAFLLGLNCTVRHYGGDAHPLSVKRIPEKMQAIALLGVHSVKHLWSSRCDDTAPFVAAAARERGIPVAFALSIARSESNFRSHVISSTGAMGIMQLMPETARQHGVSDPFDPPDNARGAVAFLDFLWKRYGGNRTRIAAAYNAGPGRVPPRGAMRVPSTTRAYAARVVRGARSPIEHFMQAPVALNQPDATDKRRTPGVGIRGASVGGL
jgi:soluble lytic murein transglycosylase-like protein